MDKNEAANVSTIGALAKTIPRHPKSGKLLYRPSGRAGEYSRWAANIFIGCSNMCQYCYCKQGILKNTLGNPVPRLKKDFVVAPRSDLASDREQAFEEGCDLAVQTFGHELDPIRDKVRSEGGVLFSYTTDSCLQSPVNTLSTYIRCSKKAWGLDENGNPNPQKTPVPVTFLTKCAGWVDSDEGRELLKIGGRNLCIGFTLTGRDDLEPNASTNAERIEAMRKCHEAGVRTFASIEPVINLNSSYDMIKATVGFCDEYKIGLLSGRQKFGCEMTLRELVWFVEDVQNLISRESPKTKIYWKDSIRSKVSGRVQFSDNVVDADYNIFASGD